MLRDEDVSLITLTGPGGIGKTRLAIALAAALRDEYRDAIAFVGLGSIRDPELVLPAIAHALGIDTGSGKSPLARIRTEVSGQRTLLVLDNFEHLTSVATLASDLSETCASLDIVVTSRAPLQLSGEREFPVAPLAVLDGAASHGVDVDRLLQNESALLFSQRVRSVRPSFTITESNVQVIAEICRRLEGIPLAIELAAARSKLLSPKTLLERLESRLDLLASSARDIPVRHQTLRNTIDWSHSLLSDAQRQIFRWLAVFEGGADLDAVQTVCLGCRSHAGSLDDLEHVLNHSLLYVTEDSSGGTRLHMLRTIEEYALERLAKAGETNDARSAHARFFADQGESIVSAPGLDLDERWRRLEREHGNLRAALKWAIDAGHTELALRIARSLGVLWENHAYLTEGRRWLQSVLSMDWDAPALRELRAAVLHTAALLATRQSDWDSAGALAEESAKLFRDEGSTKGEAHALLTRALVATMRDDRTTSARLHEMLLPMFEALGDEMSLARATHNYGLVYRFEDPARARQLGEKAMALYQEAGNPRGVAQARNLIGWALLNSGDALAARASFESSLRGSWRQNARWVTGYVLQGLSDALRMLGHAEVAVHACAVSDALFREVDAPIRQVRLERHYRELVASLQATLGKASFDRQWKRAASMTPDSLMEVLPSLRDPSPRERRSEPRRAAMDGPPLTRRETEVLQELASGLSDRGIAKRLDLSPTTASKHVANILAKTGFKNRTELAVWAVEQGLHRS